MTKCDECTGLACGDECDGQSHATSKRSLSEGFASIREKYGADFDRMFPDPSKVSDTAIGEAISTLRVNALRHGDKYLEDIADRAHTELMAIREGNPAKVSEDVEYCIWVEEGDGYEGLNSFNTSCGHNFYFDEGGPEDNGAKFCLFCGKPVEQVLYEREEDDDDD